MMNLIRQEILSLIQLLALLFGEEILLSGLLELGILTVTEIWVGCFDFGFGIGVGRHEQLWER